MSSLFASAFQVVVFDLWHPVVLWMLLSYAMFIGAMMLPKQEELEYS